MSALTGMIGGIILGNCLLVSFLSPPGLDTPGGQGLRLSWSSLYSSVPLWWLSCLAILGLFSCACLKLGDSSEVLLVQKLSSVVTAFHPGDTPRLGTYQAHQPVFQVSSRSMAVRTSGERHPAWMLTCVYVPRLLGRWIWSVPDLGSGEGSAPCLPTAPLLGLLHCWTGLWGDCFWGGVVHCLGFVPSHCPAAWCMGSSGEWIATSVMECFLSSGRCCSG